MQSKKPVEIIRNKPALLRCAPNRTDLIKTSTFNQQLKMDVLLSDAE